jgi:hypothetical protein
MDGLSKWFKSMIEDKKVEPNPGLGKAINYMRKNWNELTLFLRVAGAPLDNNICKRALKKAILHRNNSLFYKNERGAYVGHQLFIPRCVQNISKWLMTNGN